MLTLLSMYVVVLVIGAMPGNSRAQAADADTTRSQADTTTVQQIPDFEAITDRWRIAAPPSDYNVRGRRSDPYNQNTLKGDYPIIGQDIFLILTGASETIAEVVRLPTPSGISTSNPLSEPFFGDPDQFVFNQNVKLSVEFYKGDVAFRPRDFEFKVTGVFNVNYLNTGENNNVNINPRKGDNRRDDHFALQELSVEKHLFNVSERYDFVAAKAGIQPFNSDFRGFIFKDFNLGGRLLGSAGNNRYQYNLIYLRMLEKDTNSELNTIFDDREQDVFIANLYRQDFIRLGYTTEFSLHYNHDNATTHFNENGFPVRPAVIGNVEPHEINAVYLGWAGDGHLGRLNISHAFYQVFGNDDFNSVAGREIDINAQMAAVELSVDYDWKRYKASMFYSSGDSDPMDDTGRGFDTIFDEPFFVGGPFSFWNSQGIRLQGVALVNKKSLVPNLRSDKIEGQSNFVNPGLLLYNLGFDAEITQKLKVAVNANYLRFAYTGVLENFLNQPNIDNNIGLDYSLGLIYRPFLNQNAVFTLSGAALTPLAGYEDIYESSSTLFLIQSSLTLTY